MLEVQSFSPGVEQGGGARKKARQEAGTEIKILSAAAFCVRALAGQLWRALV